MNWTGGNLQRHSRNGGKALLQRQKAHFARARVQDNAPQSTHFHQSFFVEPGGSQQSHRHRRAEESNRGSGPRERASLPKHHTSPRSRRSQPEYEEERRSIKRRVDDGDHIARPVPQRQHSVQTISSTTSDDYASSDEEEDAIAATLNSETASQSENKLAYDRQRLLSRGDWLGLERSKPVHLAYSPSSARRNHGKRRRVDNSHQQGGITNYHHQTARRVFEQDNLMSGAVPVGDIDVRIGSQALDSRSTSIASPTESMMQLQQGIPSDSLLLGTVDEDLDQSYSNVSNADMERFFRSRHSSVAQAHQGPRSPCHFVGRESNLDEDDQITEYADSNDPELEDHDTAWDNCGSRCDLTPTRLPRSGHSTQTIQTVQPDSLPGREPDIKPFIEASNAWHRFLGIDSDSSSSHSHQTQSPREAPNRLQRQNSSSLDAIDGTHQEEDASPEMNETWHSENLPAPTSPAKIIRPRSPEPNRRPRARPTGYGWNLPSTTQVVESMDESNETWKKFVFGSEDDASDMDLQYDASTRDRTPVNSSIAVGLPTSLFHPSDAAVQSVSDRYVDIDSRS